MAKLVLISESMAISWNEFLDDVFGVYEDNHPFTDNELNQFNFLTIGGSAADVQARLKQIRPKIAECFYDVVDQKWTFTFVKETDVKRVWQPSDGGNKWYSLVQPFAFPINISTLTPEEKQLLETVDIKHPSIDSFMRKIVKDLIAANPDNGVEEKDLRNTQPE